MPKQQIDVEIVSAPTPEERASEAYEDWKAQFRRHIHEVQFLLHEVEHGSVAAGRALIDSRL